MKKPHQCLEISLGSGRYARICTGGPMHIDTMNALVRLIECACRTLPEYSDVEIYACEPKKKP